MTRSEDSLRGRTFLADDLFRLVCDGLGDAISVQDRDFTVLYQNPAHRRLMGAHEGERCYAAYQRRDRVCPGCHLALAFADGEVHTKEQCVRREEGTTYVEITASPIKDASGAVIAGIEAVRNITPRKRAEEQLRITHHAVESAMSAIAIADLQGVLTYVNPAFLALWGYAAPAEACGRSALDFWRDRERAAEVIGELRARGSCSGELVGTRKDGTPFDVELNANIVRDEAGKPLYLFASFVDRTEHKRLEQERLRAQKLESLGVLAGGIAHDFNNLLTGILGSIDVLKLRTAPDTGAQRLLGDAEKAALRARNLTLQLLTFARGGAPVKKEIHLDGMIEEAVGFALRGSGVKAAFDLPPDLLHVDADEDQLHQVVNNVVLNAVQSMPGGGLLQVAGRNVTLARGEVPPLPPGRYVELSFRDTGAGIPARHLARIFDPYFTTKERGSGLGLATVYSVVKAHGGHVAVESAEGAGTTMRLYLPAVERQRAAREEAAARPAGGRGRVLLMDDEDLILRVAGEMARVLGYDVTTARDGAEALERCRAAVQEGRPFDAAILDLTVPGGMGGKEAGRLLRERHPRTAVIVSSGYSQDAVLADHRAHGFAAALRKPFQLVELDLALREAMRPVAEDAPAS